MGHDAQEQGGLRVHHHPNLRTVEGVETEEQLAALREEGCDMAQGYLVSRPLPADAMVEFLRAHSLARASAR